MFAMTPLPLSWIMLWIMLYEFDWICFFCGFIKKCPPPTWGDNPIWLIFFKWVESTNYVCGRLPATPQPRHALTNLPQETCRESQQVSSVRTCIKFHENPTTANNTTFNLWGFIPPIWAWGFNLHNLHGLLGTPKGCKYIGYIGADLIFKLVNSSWQVALHCDREPTQRDPWFRVLEHHPYRDPGSPCEWMIGVSNHLLNARYF